MNLPRSILRAPDGQPMMVVRPATRDGVKVALATAAHALRTQNAELLYAPPADEYVFVGWLSRKDRKSILNERGEVIGHLQAGDSLVTEKERKGP